MQLIFDPKCSPSEYHAQGKNYAFPDLTGEPCPRCHSSLLRGHGFYLRWLISVDFSDIIPIRRYICKSCGKTVSLLPSFAHPRYSYSILFIITLLNLYYLEQLSVTETINSFNQSTIVDCSRQLLRQISKRFEQNLNRLTMGFTALFKCKEPAITAPLTEKRQRAREFLEHIKSFAPCDVSLKLFELSRTTFLTTRAT